MFTTRGSKPVAQKAERKSVGADTAPDSKPAAKLNPIWQQLATQAAAVRPKLAVSRPDDPDEREADRVSEQMMRMPEPQLRRACVCGGGCSECQGEQTAREQNRLQTKHVTSNDSGQTAAPPIVHEVLSSPGQNLDSAARGFMAPRFGHDFSQVRIHSDEKAAESARAVGALAYAVGRHVVFGAGAYQPATRDGRRLLAHELAHVVQQGASAGPGVLRRSVAGACEFQASPDGCSSGTCDHGKTCMAMVDWPTCGCWGTSAVGGTDALQRQKACVRRLGGCPETHPGGLPSNDELRRYNQQCREESAYRGPDLVPDCGH